MWRDSRDLGGLRINQLRIVISAANERPVFGSYDLSQPIRGKLPTYLGMMPGSPGTLSRLARLAKDLSRELRISSLSSDNFLNIEMENGHDNKHLDNHFFFDDYMHEED